MTYPTKDMDWNDLEQQIHAEGGPEYFFLLYKDPKEFTDSTLMKKATAFVSAYEDLAEYLEEMGVELD